MGSIRFAASLLLLRDGPAGLEVLMLRRADGDAFDLRSGAAVFPGGVVDAADRAAHAFCDGADDAAWTARLGLPATAGGGLDFAVAALRECFEETGVLLADRAFDGAALEPWRARLQAGSATIGGLCGAEGLRLSTGALAYFSHWLTPPGVPKRFDTRFFAALAPAGQTAVPDLGEAVEAMWLTPQAALAPARGLKLLPVTRRTLQELARSASVQAALDEALARRDIALTMPRRAASATGSPRIVLPDEPAYAEVARLDPEGRGEAACDIVPGRAVRLSQRVLRVTAPNPGPMTGPGTNTYLVGGPAAWTVIDPGPESPPHARAVLAAVAGVGGHVERILVTHTHRDHSPGAVALAQATGAPVFGRSPLHAERQDSGFAPAAELVHGQLYTAGEAVAGVRCTLRVVHTPGHASNHLCFLLEEEKTLFTGDHVMGGSTVVIDPPDGDMAAYLRSLHALLDEDLDWLAPGHGFLVDAPHAVLRALIAHRAKREAKVLAALGEGTPGQPLDALLPAVYADVAAALLPVARRSLLAHLLKLQADGVAVLGPDGRWSRLG